MFSINNIPHNGHIYFCKHGHLIKGHTTENELFPPKELILVCKCGEPSIFSISKKEISIMLSNSGNIEKIIIGTHKIKNKNGKFIRFEVYDIARLGYKFLEVIKTCKIKHDNKKEEPQSDQLAG